MRPFSFRSFLALIRFKVTIAVTFSAYTSALMYRRGLSIADILPVSGIFLLAAGASALNQYQERETDAKMPRTLHRPLPSGEIKPVTSLMIALFLIAAGLMFIAITDHWVTLGLGIFNILWYNGIYTNLKMKTAFAVVPGALTGAIPVLMGWTAAGGHLFDPLPLFLAFFIFLWQVPHFWLLALMYEGDYKGVGFPVLSNHFSVYQMKRIIFSWLLAASFSSFLLILFHIVNLYWPVIFIIVMNVVLIILSAMFLFFTRISGYRSLFIIVNIFMLLVFCLIIGENIYP